MAQPTSEDRQQRITDLHSTIIQQDLKKEVFRTNLSFRQIISVQEVAVAKYQSDIKDIKKKTHFSWLRQKRIHFKKKKIAEIRAKIRYLKKNIRLENDLRNNFLEKTSNNKKIPLNTKQHFHFQINNRLFIANFKQYMRQQFYTDILKIWLGSLFTTIGFVYFINSTTSSGLFPAGLGALARLMAIIIVKGDVERLNYYYFLIYLIINIPLIFFSFWKVGFKFTVLTTAFILFQNLNNLIIENINFLNPTHLMFLIDFQEIMLRNIKNGPENLIWLFVFALIGGIIASPGFAIIYRAGGSTGGIDIIGAYIVKKRSISLASINMVLNIASLVIVFFINIFLITDKQLMNYFHLDHELTNTTRRRYQIAFFFGPSMFSSILLLLTIRTVVNYLYPRYTFLLVKIKTHNPFDMMTALRYRGFSSKIRLIVDNTNFNLKQKKEVTNKILELHCSLTDWKELKIIINVVDDQANFTIFRVYKYQGEKVTDAFLKN